MSPGSTQVYGKKSNSSGNARFMRIKFLARWFFLVIEYMPGKWFTFWYGFILVKKSAVIGRSCQETSQSFTSFWLCSPRQIAPSWSSLYSLNLYPSTFLATFETISYSVQWTFMTILPVSSSLPELLISASLSSIAAFWSPSPSIASFALVAPVALSFFLVVLNSSS